MARTNAKDQKRKSNGATVGYEQQLWQIADALRGSMDAAEHKHVVLGLIFLKYISDTFKDFHAIPCVIPPRELLLAHDAHVSLLEDRIEVNDRESRTLAALRDPLLPKLISGDLRLTHEKQP